jgi:peptidoglycan/LPS O-acetylase OafA/YrhL
VFHYPLILLDERLFPISSLSAHLHSLTLAMGIYALASTTVSFVAAWLSWHLYEKHFIKLKVRFALPAAPAQALVPVPAVAQANGRALA